MYKFRDGYHAPKGLAAERAAIELERIRKARGELTPISIIEESRKKTAPLHTVFEWNDSVAANKYREKQASTLVRAIVVIHPETKEKENFEYVLTIKDDKRQYMPTNMVVKDAGMYDFSYQRAVRLLEAARGAVDDLVKAKNHLPPKRRRAIEQAAKHLSKASNAVAGM